MYIEAPENRQSLTILETISAAGLSIPPFLIIQGKLHMENWYHRNLKGEERITVSDSGYTNSELALEYLKHFIKHTHSNETTPPKLLLMDSHISHTTPEFALLAHANHIHPYQFPSHLTHILQPLDVSVFAVYKHWHNRAVQKAMRDMDIDYTVSSFLRDLTEVREQTFKKGTVIKAFRESGMWPPNFSIIEKKIAVYAPPRPSTPLPHIHASHQLIDWNHRFQNILSSPSAHKWEESYSLVQAQLIESSLLLSELKQITTQVSEQKKRRLRSRKSIQKGGVYSVSKAHSAIADKERREQKKSAEKEARVFKRLQV